MHVIDTLPVVANGPPRCIEETKRRYCNNTKDAHAKKNGIVVDVGQRYTETECSRPISRTENEKLKGNARSSGSTVANLGYMQKVDQP
jgi:hypothetical protein